jgi:hypothetical protein
MEINRHITYKEFGSSIKVNKDGIRKAVSKFTEKEEKDWLKEEKILLNQDSINRIAEILRSPRDSHLEIVSKISGSFEWDRDSIKKGELQNKFWATPFDLKISLAKLFYNNLVERFMDRGFEKHKESFGYFTLLKSFNLSNEIWPDITYIINKINLEGNYGAGQVDANYFNDSRLNYRLIIKLKDNIILSMNYHDQSRKRHGYRPKD